MSRSPIKILVTLSCILLLSFTCSNQLFAQEKTPIEKWKLDGSIGTSIPLGKFKKGGALSFWGTTGNGNQIFRGIRRAYNGFAQTGVRLSLDLSYQAREYFSLGIQSSYQTHSIDQDLIKQVFVNNNVELPASIKHDPYKSQMVIPYLSLQFPDVEPELSLRLGYGYGRLAYPSYSFIDQNGGNLGHSVRADAIHSGVIMTGVKASFPFRIFKVFASLDYTAANFDYLSVNRSASVNRERSFYDTVNLKTLNIAFGMSYDF